MQCSFSTAPHLEQRDLPQTPLLLLVLPRGPCKPLQVLLRFLEIVRNAKGRTEKAQFAIAIHCKGEDEGFRGHSEGLAALAIRDQTIRPDRNRFTQETTELDHGTSIHLQCECVDVWEDPLTSTPPAKCEKMVRVEEVRNLAVKADPDWKCSRSSPVVPKWKKDPSAST